eukprot:3715920-Amphidinium_carterae.1
MRPGRALRFLEVPRPSCGASADVMCAEIKRSLRQHLQARVFSSSYNSDRSTCALDLGKLVVAAV